MSFKAIFNQVDNEKRLVGYTSVGYSSNDENEIVKQVSESELNKLIPEGFDADNWKEVRRHYKLDDSRNIVFDEGYEPETEEQ